MRYRHLLLPISVLLISVLLVRAADTGMAGRYTGEWKSDSSSNSGTLSVNIEPAPNETWKCEITFTFGGEELKTKMQSCKLDKSQLEAVYDYEIQDTTGRAKLTGHWDGKAFAGRYQSTPIGSSDITDAGAWNASRVK